MLSINKVWKNWKEKHLYSLFKDVKEQQLGTESCNCEVQRKAGISKVKAIK